MALEGVIGESLETLEAAPDNRDHIINIGKIALAGRTFSLAERAFGKLNTPDTTDTEVLLGHGQALTGLSDREGVIQGISELQRAEALSEEDLPVQARVEVALGEAYGRIGSYDYALDSYLLALDANDRITDDEQKTKEAAFLEREDVDLLLQELHDQAITAETANDPHRQRLARERAVVAALNAPSALDDQSDPPSLESTNEEILQRIRDLQTQIDGTDNEGQRADLGVLLGEAYGSIGCYRIALNCYLNARDDNREHMDVQFLNRLEDDQNNISAILQEFHDGAMEAEVSGNNYAHVYRDRAVIAALAAQPPVYDEPYEEAATDTEA